jgi:hypothetical protein
MSDMAEKVEDGTDDDAWHGQSDIPTALQVISCGDKRADQDPDRIPRSEVIAQ